MLVLYSQGSVQITRPRDCPSDVIFWAATQFTVGGNRSDRLIQNYLLTWCVVRKCNISLDVFRAIASTDNRFNISDKDHAG